MILAFGAFKGVATSLTVAQSVDRAVREHRPGLEPVVCPLADGGEGTLEAMRHHLGGTVATYAASGPHGREVGADVLWLDARTAIIESAQTVGYSLIDQRSRDPWTATSRGVGELLLHVARAGATSVYVTMGDSVVMDMGLGALQGLGAKLVDARGREVALGTLREALHIERVVLPGAAARSGFPRVRVLGDTLDDLVGPHGQVAVYGRQKGLAAGDEVEMSAVATHVNRVFRETFDRDLGSVPLSSGSGGLAAALHGALDAPLEHLVPWLLTRSGIDGHLSVEEVVVTGEGRLDDQTRWGKVPFEVARQCRSRLIVACGTSTTQGRSDLEAATSATDVTFVDVPTGPGGRAAWLAALGAAVAEAV